MTVTLACSLSESLTVRYSLYRRRRHTLYLAAFACVRVGERESWCSGLMCAVVLVCSYLPLELGFVFLMLAEAEEEELVGVKGVLDLYYAREEEMRR